MKKIHVLIILSSLFIFFGIGSVQAQSQFYKQFKGKIGDKEVRVELIRASSKDNPQFNLRGSYYYERMGEQIKLNQGNMDNLGNIYLEEGVMKKDYNGQNSFAKTGTFRGTYYSNLGRLEGTWDGVSGQKLDFFFQEDYSNQSISAEIIFNDLHYEEADIRFHFPRFQNHPQAANINQYVQKNILGDMQAKMLQFMQNYQEVASLGGMVDVFESSNIGYIRHNENNILCFEYTTNSYEGGTHGIYHTTFYNFNLQNGTLLTLDELLNKGYETTLSQVAEQIFRRNFGIQPNASLGEFGFNFPGNTFRLSNNFYITRTGIGFFYNVYEIAPYAVGSLEVFVPFAQIKSLVKKNGLLGPYIN